MNEPPADRLPPGEAQLWDDLRAAASAPSELEEIELLTMVVDAAHRGEDAARRFPDFFRRMLASPVLQDAFVNALFALESSETGEEAAGDETDVVSGALSAIEPCFDTSAGRLRCTWQLAAERLHDIFFPPAPAFVYRDNDLVGEDVTLALLDGIMPLPKGDLRLLLNAVQPLETPDELRLVAWLEVEAGEITQWPAGGVHLHLTWGAYQAEQVLAAPGRADFPPLLVAMALSPPDEPTAALVLHVDFEQA